MKGLLILICLLGSQIFLSAAEKDKNTAIIDFISKSKFGEGEISGAGPKDGTLILLIGGKEVLLMKKDLSWQKVPRQKFADHEIPENALAACHGWWAGYGQTFYLTLVEDGVNVYYCELDERDPNLKFTLLKRIRISELHKN